MFTRFIEHLSRVKDTLLKNWSAHYLEITFFLLVFSFFSRVITIGSLGSGMILCPEERFFCLAVFLISLLWFRNYFLSTLLDLSFVQFYLYSCFRLENFLNKISWLYLPLWFLGICFDLLGMLLCIYSYFFFTSFYFNFQRIMLNPEICSSFPGLEKAEDLTWENIFSQTHHQSSCILFHHLKVYL